MITIITTLHKKEDASRIGNGLLKKRLIACYNLWPVDSAYWWKDEILKETETMMLIKTSKNRYDEISAYIAKESGYEVPDIFAISPTRVDASFDAWIDKEASS